MFDFILKALIAVLVILLCVVIYDGYKTAIWMSNNNCQKTSEYRTETYFMTVNAGNTIVLVPQEVDVFLYKCDNNQTIWHE